MEPLDHGILNVPLAKRGNIDAEIDRYLNARAAEEAKRYKAARAAGKALSAQAKQTLEEILSKPGLIETKAAATGKSKREIVKALREIASLQPKRMEVFRRQWLGESMK